MVNQGFFGNISNTIHLMKSCVNVLKKDKELVLFPIMAAICVIVLLGIIYSIGVITSDIMLWKSVKNCLIIKYT